MISTLNRDNIPTVTISLIIICVIIFFGTFDITTGRINPQYASPFWFALRPGMAEILSGQVWRLITPIFIHLGMLHILFNMLWLWDLGVTLESRFGKIYLLIMVLVFGLAGNVAQYFFSGPAFGGMSGVVFGLLGYVWIVGKLNPRIGLALHPEIALFMGIWFVFGWVDGFLNIFGMNIANWAHTGGLLAGFAWGFVHAKLVRW
jgi:GlpG protein